MNKGKEKKDEVFFFFKDKYVQWVHNWVWASCYCGEQSGILQLLSFDEEEDGKLVG